VDTLERDSTKKQNRATRRRKKIEARLYTSSVPDRQSTAAWNYDILSHVFDGDTWKLGFLSRQVPGPHGSEMEVKLKFDKI
jgi:hypothetical protein